jgi:hypothetical protein
MLSRQNVIMLQHPYPIKKQGRIKRRIKGNKNLIIHNNYIII